MKKFEKLLTKALLLDNDSDLPSYILKQVFAIEAPFDDYFIIKVPPRLKAILKLKDRPLKLRALEEINNEAQKQYEEYIDTYTTFIYSLNDLIKSDKPSDEDRTASPAEVISYFEAKEEVYRYSINQINDALADLRATTYIENRYIKRKNNLSREDVPIDIDEEFSKLFISDAVKDGFIVVLKHYHYIDEDMQWKGVSGFPGELREAYHALKDLNLLKPSQKSTRSLKVLYKKFGLNLKGPGVDNPYISERALRNKYYTNDYKILKKRLSELVNLKK